MLCFCVLLFTFETISPADKGKGTKNTAKVGVFRVVDTQDSSDISLSWAEEEAVEVEPRHAAEGFPPSTVGTF